MLGVARTLQCCKGILDQTPPTLPMPTFQLEKHPSLEIPTLLDCHCDIQAKKWWTCGIYTWPFLSDSALWPPDSADSPVNQLQTFCARGCSPETANPEARSLLYSLLLVLWALDQKNHLCLASGHFSLEAGKLSRKALLCPQEKGISGFGRKHPEGWQAYHLLYIQAREFQRPRAQDVREGNSDLCVCVNFFSNTHSS